MKTILVVDDEEGQRQVIERLLVGHGYSVVAAECMKDAIRALKENYIDLVIADICLPDGSGFDLKKEHRMKGPCIFISGQDDPFIAYEGEPDTMFLMKPFNPLLLLLRANDLIKDWNTAENNHV